MRRPRRWFQVRTLMGAVLMVALGVKVVLIVQEWREWQARLQVIAALGWSGGTPPFKEPELLAALDDPYSRPGAIWALDAIGSTSPAFVRALAEELETETQKVMWEGRRDPQRIDPARALWRIKPPSDVIIPLLREATRSEDSWVRSQAAEVLSEVAERPGPAPPTLSPPLLASLRPRDSMTRLRAAGALACLDGETRRRAIAILLEQLREPDPTSQLLAATSLGRFGAEAREAVAVLTGRLEGGDLDGRLAALYLIGRLGPLAITAVPAVVRAMTSPDSEKHGFFFLSRYLNGWDKRNPSMILDPDDVVSQLSTSPQVGALALAKIGPEAERRAIEILVEASRGEDDSRGLKAFEALGAIGPKASSSIPGLLELVEREASARPENDDGMALRRLRAVRQVCTSDDPRFVAALVRMLGATDREKRWAAATVLGDSRQPALAAAPVLVGLLKGETQSVRFSAARTLGLYDGPEWAAAVPALLEALEDKDGWVVYEAANSLARHRAEAGRVVPKVATLLEGKNRGLRGFAAELLGKFGPEARQAVPALLRARDDEGKFVRDEVAKALKAIGPPPEARPPEE